MFQKDLFVSCMEMDWVGLCPNALPLILALSISFNFASVLFLLVQSKDIHLIHDEIASQRQFMIDVEGEKQTISI